MPAALAHRASSRVVMPWSVSPFAGRRGWSRAPGRAAGRPGCWWAVPGGDDLVGVPHFLDAVVVAGGVHLLPPDLEFLGRTRSQSDVDDLPGIQSHLFGKVGLNRGTLHADGAFGSGEMGQQFRGIDLSKVYPAGTSANEQRKGANI